MFDILHYLYTCAHPCILLFIRSQHMSFINLSILLCIQKYFLSFRKYSNTINSCKLYKRHISKEIHTQKSYMKYTK